MPRKIRDAADAHACLDAVAASHLDRVTWARQHDVCARSLNAWRVALLRRSRRGLVELLPMSVPMTRTVAIRRGPWEVEVSSDVDAALLIRVLTAVAAC